MPEAEQARWNAEMTALLERAVAAHAAGAQPASAEVQALAEEWLGFFAAARGRPNDAAFAQWFVGEAPRLMPDTIERFWERMARLLGHPPTTPSFDAQRLLLAAAQLRAAGEV